MIELVIAGLVCFVICMLLAIHHYCIHSAAPPEDASICCLLQPSDVCALRCTHENWILLFLAVGVILLISGALSEPVARDRTTTRYFPAKHLVGYDERFAPLPAPFGV